LAKPQLFAAPVALALLTGANPVAASAQALPAASSQRQDAIAVATRLARWQLARMDDAQHISRATGETGNPRGWEKAVFWTGMTALADAGGPPEIGRAILAMGKANDWTPGSRPFHADDLAISQVYLWAARHGAGPAALAPTRRKFDYIVAHPPQVGLAYYQPPQGYDATECLTRWCWCDALFMAPPAWAEMSQQTRDPRYVEFAMGEFWATTDFLYDPAEKLFFRDSRFFERRDAQGRKQFWSRGNGWVFAGIADLLEFLPKNSPHRPRLEKLFREMAAKLISLQKPDGYWPPSLLAPENSPPETSGTGFYVYGLAWGVKRGLLDGADYRPAIDKGWAALTRAVARDGRVGWVQQVSDRPDVVAESDTQFYGVGAFLLAASAVAALTEG